MNSSLRTGPQQLTAVCRDRRSEQSRGAPRGSSSSSSDTTCYSTQRATKSDVFLLSVERQEGRLRFEGCGRGTEGALKLPQRSGTENSCAKKPGPFFTWRESRPGRERGRRWQRNGGQLRHECLGKEWEEGRREAHFTDDDKRPRDDWQRAAAGGGPRKAKRRGVSAGKYWMNSGAADVFRLLVPAHPKQVKKRFR